VLAVSHEYDGVASSRPPGGPFTSRWHALRGACRGTDPEDGPYEALPRHIAGAVADAPVLFIADGGDDACGTLMHEPWVIASREYRAK
jgi:hypothetical protein